MMNKQYTMENKLPILLSFLLPLFISPASVSSQFHELNWFCLDEGNYMADSIYETNLKPLFAYLTEQASHAPFGNYSVGERINRVNMIYMCRGYLNGEECHNCIQAITKRVIALCPTEKGAIFWQQECMLRYSNHAIYSIEEKGSYAWDYSIENVSNPLPYDEVVTKTIDGLIMEAAYNQSKAGYAIGEGNVSGLVQGSNKVYCLVQCTPDILGIRCEGCLRAAFRAIAGCCGVNRLSVQFYYPSCQIHYDVVNFIMGANTPSALPASRVPPTNSTLPPSSTTGSRKASKKKKASVVTTVAVPVIAATILVLLLFGCYWYYIYNRKTEETAADRANQEEISKSNDLSEISVPESLQFDFNTLKVATNDFSAENKLGQGGFGPVYKGKLQNGHEIAVKRLSHNSGQGIEEFKNEALFLVKLQHKNLVRLLGFCVERQEKLLVYELVPNLSLEKFLFDPDKRALLDWQTRYKIITGIARGLMYLHEDSRLTIIHRDLKCSNVLLDKAMNPRISDFGTARLFGADQIQANTNRIVGTYGYMAPEYAMHGDFSIKSDVYSFGVIILEIVSGQSNSYTRSSEYEHRLVHRAWTLWNDNKALSLVDMALGNLFSKEEVTKCIHIGLLCVQDDATKRPTLHKIVHAINDDHSGINLPKPASPQLLMTNDIGPTQVSYGSVPSQSAITDTRCSSQGFGTLATSEISDLYPR